jgi:hypothetical protein
VTPDEIDAALQRAELGPYQPLEEDWEAIEEAARAEGEVVLYSLSSRHPPILEIFEQRYGVTPVYAGWSPRTRCSASTRSSARTGPRWT